ncbi:alpha/beta hydrolase [Pelagicoccus sp. SDUM812003]|uniref:alpha/beta hydrolase n=1 Tax=Pelagicoccus sp. SDUM812003 TaxID=3041267 RepID=UPI00280FE570|nr:alpha/beta hydrolase [Pelagicoccus sp. SDUM812003]MDQ8203771.1 alpha/beta hydrolase [Pelagicoccus sp. SDUM812003]
MLRSLIALFIPSMLLAMPSSPVTIPLWNETPPNHRSSELEETHYEGDILSVTLVQEPSIEVRLPSRSNATGDAMLVCPGGGYGFLAYDWEGTDIAAWLNANGIAAIVLKYRLPEDESNEQPRLTPLMDAQRAMRLARFHAEDWGYQKDRIGVIGFSAGGHLASTLGTHFDLGDPEALDEVERMSCRPDFMALLYPVISMDESVTHMGSRNNLLGEDPPSDWVQEFSNELQVGPDTPPTFLVHSSDDGAVPVANSLRFYEALLKNEVETEMHLYPYGGHGYSLAINKGRLGEWPELCARWIKELSLD